MHAGIIGASVAGLTAAIALRKLGARVTLFTLDNRAADESKPTASDDPALLYPDLIPVLRQLGLFTELEAKAAAISKLQISSEVTKRQAKKEIDLDMPIFCLRMAEFFRLLYQRSREIGVEIDDRSSITELVYASDGQVELKGTQSKHFGRFQLAILAAGLEHHITYPGFSAPKKMVADWVPIHMLLSQLELHDSKKGAVAAAGKKQLAMLFPMGTPSQGLNGHTIPYSLSWHVKSKALAGLLQAGPEALARPVYAFWPEIGLMLQKGGTLNVGSSIWLRSKKLQAKNILLLGPRAYHGPFLPGLDTALAIRTSSNLAIQLAADKTRQEAFHCWEGQARQEIDSTFCWSKLAWSFLMDEGDFMSGVRNNMLRRMLNSRQGTSLISWILHHKILRSRGRKTGRKQNLRDWRYEPL